MAENKKIIPGNLLLNETIKSKTSNNIYEIFFFDNCVACTCPAGGRRTLCKHIIQVFHDNFELIKEQAPVLFEKLLKTIEIKNNKSISKDEKNEAYMEIIYSNKEISEKSHLNTIEIEESDKREIEELCKILESDSDLSLVFYDFLKQLRTDPYSVFISKKNESIIKLIELKYLTEYSITDSICEKYNIVEKNKYIAFMGNEILYTNKLIYGKAKNIQLNSQVLSEFRIFKIDTDYGAVLK